MRYRNLENDPSKFQDISHHSGSTVVNHMNVMFGAMQELISMPLVFVQLYRYYIFHWWNIIRFHKESKFTQYYFILQKWQHL